MFRLVLYARFVMLFASLGATLGALMMFWVGATKLLHAFKTLVGSDDEGVTASFVMAATDSFLFGIVLMIFTYAITFVFVFDLSESDKQRLPGWMRIEGIGELKHTLVQVILVYLVVDFATDVAEQGMHLSWQTLVMPVSILLLAGALRLMSGPLHAPVKE